MPSVASTPNPLIFEDVFVGRPCRTEQRWELLRERIDEDDGAYRTSRIELPIELDEEAEPADLWG